MVIGLPVLRRERRAEHRHQYDDRWELELARLCARGRCRSRLARAGHANHRSRRPERHIERCHSRRRESCEHGSHCRGLQHRRCVARGLYRPRCMQLCSFQRSGLLPPNREPRPPYRCGHFRFDRLLYLPGLCPVRESKRLREFGHRRCELPDAHPDLWHLLPKPVRRPHECKSESIFDFLHPFFGFRQLHLHRHDGPCNRVAESDQRPSRFPRLGRLI